MIFRPVTFSKSFRLSVNTAAFTASACCAIKASFILILHSFDNLMASIATSDENSSHWANGCSKIFIVLKEASCTLRTLLSMWNTSEVMIAFMPNESLANNSFNLWDATSYSSEFAFSENIQILESTIIMVSMPPPSVYPIALLSL